MYSIIKFTKKSKKIYEINNLEKAKDYLLKIMNRDKDPLFLITNLENIKCYNQTVNDYQLLYRYIKIISNKCSDQDCYNILHYINSAINLEINKIKIIDILNYFDVANYNKVKIDEKFKLDKYIGNNLPELKLLINYILGNEIAGDFSCDKLMYYVEEYCIIQNNNFIVLSN